MLDNHRQNTELGSRVSSPKIRRFLIVAVLVVAAGGIAAVTLCAYSWSCRQLSYAFISGAAIAKVGHDAKRVVVSHSPRLVADYYAAPGNKPLILFIHGSEKDGRRSALTRLLASRLRADGFPVLALDLPGFGESEDPVLPLAKDFRFEDAVVRAARYAVKSNMAQPGRIVYAGHSLGAGVVLRASRIKPQPSSVVAIGAPITQDRFERYGRSWQRRFAEERLRDMELVPDEQSLDVLGSYLVEMDPAAQLGKGGLPPVLIVYGELEADYSVPILRDHLAATNTHNGLYVVPRAPHSYYITDGPWGLVFYNRDMLNSLAKAIEDWILHPPV
jgi:pimeloyl-ACP methyl ester carboxylesterase